MRWLKKHIITFVLLVFLLAGFGLILYPSVSDWWNSMHMSRAIASYIDTVNTMDETQSRQVLKEAREYNEHLRTLPDHWHLSDEELAYYEKMLNVDGSGVMGYLTIPKIDVRLPVYHGTEEAVLQRAIGHLEGTSLPVGGKGTHAVVSGHRGLPGARLLTDLDRMQIGDTFYLTVLNQTFTYAVDQIKVVLPSEMEELEIDPEQDYVTLVTCTPYGINTHRMLVRGHRIPNPQGAAEASDEAYQIAVKQIVPIALIPTVLILLIIGLLLPGSRVNLISMAEVDEALEMMERKRRRRR